jgi:hypothetical protein
VENIIPGPRRQHSPNKEQDDTPRTGVEAETPSKSRLSPLSSPSPCQSRARRNLQRTPPPGAIAFEIGKEASFDGFQQHQQHQQQLPVTAFGVAMCRSPVDSSNHEEQRTSTPRRLQFGAAKYAKLPPDSYVEDIESVHRRAIDNARAIDYAPTGTQQRSTSTRTFADLHDALDKSLLWKPSNAKRLVHHTEDHNKLGEEQGGSRSGRTAIDIANRKAQTYFFTRLTKTGLGTFDNDANPATIGLSPRSRSQQVGLSACLK